MLTKYTFLLLLFFAATYVCSAQTARPSLHLVNGNTYYLASTGTSSIAQNITGSESKVNLATSFRMAFKVTGKEDTIYNLQVSYQQLKMKINTADTTIEIDSKKHDQLDTASSLIAEMMNKSFSITLSAGGRVTSVENADRIIAGVFDKFPRIDTAKKAQIKRWFMQSFGENAFKAIIESGVAIFPRLVVTKGSKWSVNTRLSSPVDINVKINYRLVDISDAFYTVHGEGTMATDQDAQPKEINGLPIKYVIEGGTLTDIKIDRRTGWILELSQKQLMAGNIEIKDNPKVPGGKTVPIFFTTDITTIGR